MGTLVDPLVQVNGLSHCLQLILHQLVSIQDFIGPIRVLTDLPTMTGIDGIAQQGAADSFPLASGEGQGLGGVHRCRVN